MAKREKIELLINSINKENNEWIEDKAAKLQSKYSLFIFVLVDHKKDPEFYNLIHSRIKYFESIVGKSVMLVSVFKELDKNKYQKRRGKLSNLYNIFYHKKTPAFNELCNSELATQALCILLEINYDNTPNLIFTDKLTSPNWHITNTNINLFEKQLKILNSNYKNSFFEIKNISSSQNLEKTKIQLREYSDVENFENSRHPILIINKIIEIVTKDKFQNLNIDSLLINIFNIKNDTVDTHLTELACLLYTLLKRNNELREIIAISRGVKRVKIAEALPKMGDGGNPALASRDKMLQTENIPQLLNRQWKNIETSTLNNLFASGYILDTMKSFMHESNDYRLYALPICVSFENEINLSVVQLIRKHLGVQMPEYFDKYCPTLTKLPVLPPTQLVPTPREIYFNNYGRKKWLPPGLGESRIGYKALKMNSAEFGSDWLTEEMTNLFLKMWKNIQEIRNLVAHPGELGEEEKEKLEKSIMELHNSGLLNAITELKEKLRHLQN